MHVTVSKWGNSLAFRIPRGVAEDAQLTVGSALDVRVENGRLVADLVADEVTLESLLAGITPENRHGEQFAGEPVGREAW